MMQYVSNSDMEVEFMESKIGRAFEELTSKEMGVKQGNGIGFPITTPITQSVTPMCPPTVTVTPTILITV